MLGFTAVELHVHETVFTHMYMFNVYIYIYFP